MFGKSVGQYLSFQRWFLVAILAVFAVRLALSLSGTPNATTKWVSVTVMLLLGTLYYGVAAHTRGFGSYKQLYPLLLFQSLLGLGDQLAGPPRHQEGDAESGLSGSLGFSLAIGAAPAR
jgi:hypothetical protein